MICKISYFLFLLVLITGWKSSDAFAQVKKLGLSMNFSSFKSPSNIKGNSFGPPYFIGNCWGTEFSYQRKSSKFEHQIFIEFNLPAKINFDDGFGNNRTTRKNSSYIFHFPINYNFIWRFLGRKKLSLGIGAAIRGQFDIMQIDYFSIGKRISKDWSTGIGLINTIQYDISPKIELGLDLSNLLFLPWLSYGKVKTTLNESSYGIVALSSMLNLSFSYKLNNKYQLDFIYKRDEFYGSGSERGHYFDSPTLTVKNYNFDKFYLRFTALLK